MDTAVSAEEMEKIERELADAREDTRRLNWLEENSHDVKIEMLTSDALNYYAKPFGNGPTLRASIDAAMKAMP